MARVGSLEGHLVGFLGGSVQRMSRLALGRRLSPTKVQAHVPLAYARFVPVQSAPRPRPMGAGKLQRARLPLARLTTRTARATSIALISPVARCPPHSSSPSSRALAGLPRDSMSPLRGLSKTL